MARRCDDAEPIEFCDNYGEPDKPTPILDLFKLVTQKNYYGVVEWVCKNRNQQPQKPVKAKMIAENFWTDELEQLPPNNYDIKISELNCKKTND